MPPTTRLEEVINFSCVFCKKVKSPENHVRDWEPLFWCELRS